LIVKGKILAYYNEPEFAMIAVDPNTMKVDTVSLYSIENLKEAAQAGLMTFRTTMPYARVYFGEVKSFEQLAAISC
jgi:hypothetical protein